MKRDEKIRISTGIFIVLLTFIVVFYYISNSGCGGGGTGSGFTPTPTTSVSEQQTILSFTGYVYNSVGSGVENANVFLIPNTSIDTTTILQSALIYKKGTLMLSGTARATAGASIVSEAEMYDEPIFLIYTQIIFLLVRILWFLTIFSAISYNRDSLPLST